MKQAVFVLIAAAAISLCGCEVVSHWNELMMINDLQLSDRQIRRYVDRQDAGYQRLCRDIENQRLSTGLWYGEIVRRYGDPVVREKVSADQTRLLYRLPMEYRDVDRIYLYINEHDQLSQWVFVPAQK